MSRLEELIYELCPDGVEYVHLGNICNITTGKLDANAQVADGKYLFFTCNEHPYKIDTFAFDTEAIIVSGNGSKVGHVNYFTGKFNAYQRTYVLSNFLNINAAFLFHYLKSYLRQYIEKHSKKGSVPYITMPMLQNFSVPLPVFSIQQEIVRILDTFTALEAELQSELDKRKAQYAYYRTGLFTMPDVSFVTLGDILQPKGYIRGPFGSALKKEYFVADGVPVYEQQHAIHDQREFRYFVTSDRADTLKRFFVKSQDLIISCSGTIGKISIIKHTDPKGIINQALLILRLDLSKVLIKYIKYYLEAFPHLIVCSTGGAITNIEKREVIEKIKIPLPPLLEQERIVTILDRFDTLVNDITQGLPAEIAARRKQYAYYRDKLLRFPRKEAAQ